MKQARTYRVFLDVKSDRSTADAFRDHWLHELGRLPGFRLASRFHDGKRRDFLETDLAPGTLAATHHEWGVEYFFSFALGVASGVVGNVMYAALKKYVDHRFLDRAVRMEAVTPQELHVDIQIDSPFGPVEVGVIDEESIKITVTEIELVRIIRDLDAESGCNRNDA